MFEICIQILQAESISTVVTDGETLGRNSTGLKPLYATCLGENSHAHMIFCKLVPATQCESGRQGGAEYAAVTSLSTSVGCTSLLIWTKEFGEMRMI